MPSAFLKTSESTKLRMIQNAFCCYALCGSKQTGSVVTPHVSAPPFSGADCPAPEAAASAFVSGEPPLAAATALAGRDSVVAASVRDLPHAQSIALIKTTNTGLIHPIGFATRLGYGLRNVVAGSLACTSSPAVAFMSRRLMVPRAASMLILQSRISNDQTA